MFLADHYVEHLASGRARYLVRVSVDALPPALARPLPVLSQAVPSIELGTWASGKVACWSCGLAWAAVLAPGCAEAGLECPGCRAATGGPVETAWCSSCGAEHECIREPGCPAEGMECPACRAPAAMVDAA